MKKNTKVLVVLLCLLQMLIFASCESKTENNGVRTEEVIVSDDLINSGNYDTPEPDGIDYQGYEFTIYGRTTDPMRSKVFACESGEDIDQQGTYDKLTELVYKRNLAVEQKFGVIIKSHYVSDNLGKMADDVGNTCMSGEEVYDLVMTSPYRMQTLFNQGYLYDWNESTTINFNDSWWYHNVISDTRINEKNYVAASDLNLSIVDFSSCILFNKDLVDVWGVENPYQMVREGRWTIEQLKMMTEGIYQDLDDSKGKTEEDYYGFSTNLAADLRPYVYSAGLKIIDASGEVPRIALNDNKGEVMTNLVSALEGLFDSEGTYAVPQSNYISATNVFAGARALFVAGTVSQISTIYSDIYRIGVLPYPMLTEQIGDTPTYYSTINGEFSVMIIPSTAMDLERTGNIVNALSRRSTQIADVLFKEVHQIRSSNTADDSEMMQLIKDGSTMDMSQIFTGDGDQPIGRVMEWLFAMRSPNFTTWYATYGDISYAYFEALFSGAAD